MRRALSILVPVGLALTMTAGALALQHPGRGATPNAAAAPAVTGGRETYRGTVVLTGVDTRNVTRTFELHLDGLTSDGELARLADIQARKGEQALEDELFRRRVGYVRVDQALGYPVSLARRVSGPDGDTLYAVMDRPLQLYEIWQGTRSRDYPFSAIEIHLGRNGKLSGDVIPIAQVELLDRGGIHFASELPQPFRLLGLQRSR